MLCNSAAELIALTKNHPVPESGGETGFVWINDAPIPRSVRMWLARKIHRFALWIAPAQPVKWRKLEEVL